MSETLYPHEAAIKYFWKNIFRLDAACSFVCAGIYFTGGHLIPFGTFFIIGCIFQGIDYKYRGLN